MKKLIFITIMLFVIVFSACRTNKNQSDNNPEVKMPVYQSNNLFAFDLFNALDIKENENFVFSPFSISSALAMTYAGARGETADQMSQTLHFSKDQEQFHANFSDWLSALEQEGANDQVIKIANSLWAQQDHPFHNDFFELIEKYYNSSLYKVDYKVDRESARNQINQWVENETNAIIKDLIQPGVLNEDTRLVLVNAIYFLSEWKIAFDPKSTRQDEFFTAIDNQTEEVPFMYMKDTLNYYENEKFQVLEMNYANDDFSMIVILPSQGNEIQDILNTPDVSKTIMQSMDSLTMQEVQVFLPSFKSRSKLDIEDVLQRMGMTLAFSNKADFSAMTPENDLKIDKVIHEAFIDVNEEGTEAAASTAVVMIRKTSIRDDKPANIFKANRPFLYMVKENKNNSILFMGQMNNPKLPS